MTKREVTSDDETQIMKKKRGRQKKSEIVQEENNMNPNNSPENIQIDLLEESESPIKKRGRKPKGGKLIIKQNDEALKPVVIPNIILHLKCSLNDLHNYNDKMNKLVTNPLSYNPNIPPSIMMYNDDKNTFFKYESEETKTENLNQESHVVAYMEKQSNASLVCSLCASKNDNDNMKTDIDDDDTNVHLKDINSKLKRLKVSLYKNNLPDKKSACFWCTYEYDNPACYIPKYEMDGSLHGYGSFCRPECAVAFLMKENIDDSTKFERYHLLNHIYSKVYDYVKNIKPAPNPYYLLEKFYGNLSIQEYRKLLKTEHMLLVIDKPLTRILPELHEDNEDMVLNIYGNGAKNTNVTTNNGVYKVKRQSEKQQGPSKSSIIRDKFGLSPQ